MLLPDGRWLVSFQDDAPRLIVGFDAFREATDANALRVLRAAITKYGKPASIMSDHGSQFYANAWEAKKKGAFEFEEKLAELDILHSLSNVGHPQTNGKMGRFHGELERKIHVFVSASADSATRTITADSGHVDGPFNNTPKKDPMDRFVKRYSNGRPHMSLDWENRDTPAQASIHNMAPPKNVVIGTLKRHGAV